MIFRNIKINSPSLRPSTPDYFRLCSSKIYQTQKNQSEWSLRLQREWQRCIGTVVFVTFTFDTVSLPIFDKVIWPHTKRSHRVKFACFDNERISEQVIRSLRQIYGYSFKYVVFPEFGSDEPYVDEHGRLRIGTARPHYHGLFFFDDKVDVSLLRQRMFELWHSCIDKCFCVEEIVDDYGFSAYVSKYVCKGIEEEHFPSELLSYVKYCRDFKRKIMNYDHLPNLVESRKFERICKFLHYYELHRPKLLCSNGIGDGYTSSELYAGVVQVWNGKRYIDKQIPSYNMRKYCFDVGIHKKKVYVTYKEGFVTYHKVGFKKKCTHWSLNDDGRVFKRNLFDKIQYNYEMALRELFMKELVFDDKDIRLLKSLHYPYFDDCKTLREFIDVFKNDVLRIDLNIPLSSFYLLMNKYRTFFRFYSYERLQAYTFRCFDFHANYNDTESFTLDNLYKDIDLLMSFGFKDYCTILDHDSSYEDYMPSYILHCKPCYEVSVLCNILEDYSRIFDVLRYIYNRHAYIERRIAYEQSKMSKSAIRNVKCC